MKNETITWSKYSNAVKATTKQTVGFENKIKYTTEELWESLIRIPTGKLTIWIRSFQIEEL